MPLKEYIMSFFKSDRLSDAKHRAEDIDREIDHKIAETQDLTQHHQLVIRREVAQSRRVVRIAEEAMELVRHPERYR